jgi:type IV secretory pathway TrbD component
MRRALRPSFPLLLWILLILGVVIWNVIVWMTFTQRIR